MFRCFYLDLRPTSNSPVRVFFLFLQVLSASTCLLGVTSTSFRFSFPCYVSILFLLNSNAAFPTVKLGYSPGTRLSASRLSAVNTDKSVQKNAACLNMDVALRPGTKTARKSPTRRPCEIVYQPTYILDRTAANFWSNVNFKTCYAVLTGAPKPIAMCPFSIR